MWMKEMCFWGVGGSSGLVEGGRKLQGEGGGQISLGSYWRQDSAWLPRESRGFWWYYGIQDDAFVKVATDSTERWLRKGSLAT